MAYLTQQFRFGWLFILLCTFYFHQALPSELQVHKEAVIHNESNNESIETTTEGLQRICLIRLKQAVKDVCSGSGSIPLFFNPPGLFLMNQTEIHGLPSGSGTTNKRTGRSFNPLMPERNRKIMRRRSRRNIVRECCMNPCRLSSLRKYCANLRDEPLVKPMSPPAPVPVSSLTLNNGKMSINPSSFNVNTLVDGGRNCLQQPYCPMEMTPGPTPQASSQCISIKDLQNFYFKLFRTQYKKDAEKISAMGFNTDNKPDTPSEIIPTQLKLSAKAYSIATNRMFRNKFAKEENILQHLNTDLHPIPTTTETSGGDENREDNEIGVSTESYLQGRWSSQVRTVKPIPIMFNIPKGTNDYLY